MRIHFYCFLIAFFINIHVGEAQVECITDITVHNKTPKQLYDFMLNLTPEKYLQWHPEHKEFKVIKATPEILESVFYFHDVINGEESKYDWEITEIENNKKIIMKSSKLSIPLVIELNFIQNGNDTQVKHYFKVGKGMTNWIVKHFFTESIINDLHRHVKEEFTNLEWLIK